MPVTLEAIDIILIALYFVGMAAVGIIFWARGGGDGGGQDEAESFFLAGRSMRWPAVGLSLFVSNVGSEHLLGLAGSASATGVACAYFEWSAALHLLLLGWLFAPVYSFYSLSLLHTHTHTHTLFSLLSSLSLSLSLSLTPCRCPMTPAGLPALRHRHAARVPRPAVRPAPPPLALAHLARPLPSHQALRLHLLGRHGAHLRLWLAEVDRRRRAGRADRLLHRGGRPRGGHRHRRRRPRLPATATKSHQSILPPSPTIGRPVGRDAGWRRHDDRRRVRASGRDERAAQRAPPLADQRGECCSFQIYHAR